MVVLMRGQCPSTRIFSVTIPQDSNTLQPINSLLFYYVTRVPDGPINIGGHRQGEKPAAVGTESLRLVVQDYRDPFKRS